jgi:hypothetical protein
VFGGPLEILIIDPADTETGQVLEGAASQISDARVRRVDLLELQRLVEPRPGVVVWLTPEPGLYDADINRALTPLLARPDTGLLVVGLPSDDEGRRSLVSQLASRGGPKLGRSLSRHLEHASWIWSTARGDGQTAYLRRSFDLDALPARAFAEFTADNRATVWVNGTLVATADDWRRPVSADVTRLLKPGANTVAVEAFNEDGPAGVLLAVHGWSADGAVPVEVVSDKAWSAATTRPVDDTWKLATALGAGWSPAVEVARLGKGPWEDRVRDDYGSDEYPVGTGGDVRMKINNGGWRRLDTTLGRVVVRQALEPSPTATRVLGAYDLTLGVAAEGKGGKVVLLAIDPEKTGSGGDVAKITASPGFVPWVRRQILWLANRDEAAAREPAAKAKQALPVFLKPEGGRWAVAPGETLTVRSASDGTVHTIDTAGLAPGAHDVAVAVAVGREYVRVAVVQRKAPDRVPVVMQFSPIPHLGVPLQKNFPDASAGLYRIVDDMIAHGATSLYLPTPLPPEQSRDVESYAQSRGMTIFFAPSKWPDGFGRDKPPEVPVHSTAYRRAAEKRLADLLTPLKQYPLLDRVWLYQDEPFHVGVESFDNAEEEKVAFSRRYGYDLRTDAMDVRDDARIWQDTLTFRTDTFADAWRTMYPIAKSILPDVEMVMNHDSHNVLGAAVHQEGKLNIDDLAHWGSDWADSLSWDIYPYLMSDFRYGPNRELKLPRMAPTHYGLAMMRNACQAGGKPMGFWFGTYNPEWFDLTPEGAKQYWMEREMCYTAVANGADYLIMGIGISIDARHWDDLGRSLKTLHNAGAGLVSAKTPRAKAAMLYPRTQILQLQEEYFNVSQSYEVFRRAFGPVDVVHEEQVSGEALDRYPVLVLWDVRLLPDRVMREIEAYVARGGTVVADCVPSMDELRRPSGRMEGLFGVRDARTDRVLWPVELLQRGKRVSTGPVPAPATTRPTDGLAFEGKNVPLVSPRPATVTDAEVLLKTRSGAPALATKKTGKGSAYLLGFCIQDTDFESRRSANAGATEALRALVASVPARAGVRSQVQSSNPEVEASLKIGRDEAYLFVISHEARDGRAIVQVRDLPFHAGRVVDLESGREIAVTRGDDGIDLTTDAPTGVTHLYRITP